MGDGAFEAVLRDLLGDWLADAPRVVLAGMIGSRNGWIEAPYLPCPADPATIARHVVRAPGSIAECWIVPGLCTGGTAAGGARADVMRGEETQLIGAGVADGVVALPGTHGKWARMDGGRVTGFHTAMTGELFALLHDRSLLGRLAVPGDAAAEADGFARGVTRSLATPSLAATLFSARAEVLIGGLAPEAVAGYLSGLLIGAEVAAFGCDGGRVTLVGAAGLRTRYADALAMAGVRDVAQVDGDAAVTAGLWRIAGEIA
jgi:2-dehydro-3-deoxygalactonokinase